MKIDHLAIWAKDLEEMKSFYEYYFNAKASDVYSNPVKNFQSYFLSFENGCRLEIMHNPNVPASNNSVTDQNIGLIHFAIAAGSKEKVDSLTKKLSDDGYSVIGHPRTTGDGYYESVILDPEHNRIEITI